MASVLNLLGKDCSGQELVSPFRQMDRQSSKLECSDGGMARLPGVKSTFQLWGYEVRACAGGFRAVGLRP